MASEKKNLVFRFPAWLNARLHWWDLQQNRIDETWLHNAGFLKGYSSLALWLPIPLAVLLAYGAPAYFLPAWRGWALLTATLLAIAAHVIVCRVVSGRLLPRLQWALLVTLGLGVWAYGRIVTPEARAWDAAPYAHSYAVLGALVLTVAMPATRWLADLLIAKQRDAFRSSFSDDLDKTQLFVGGNPPPDAWPSVVRALSMVPVASSVLLLFVPALFVLVGPRVESWGFSILVLLIWWVFLSTAYYNERLTNFRDLLSDGLLSGWPLVLSLVVIGIAGARLAGVSHITTVLDQPDIAGVVVGTLAFSYLLFWLHNYWEERAVAEVLLGLLHRGEEHPTHIPYRTGRLQIHGSGRLIAIREVDQANREEDFQSYRPLDVFRRIVEQLEGRARAEPGGDERKQKWEIAGAAAHCLDALEQKVRLYYVLLLVPPSVLVLLAAAAIFNQQQEAGLRVDPARAERFFDMHEALSGSPDEPRFAVAASGGGTRAALYAYSLLRGLREHEVLDRVVLLSGVSGGSLSVAHFAAHRVDLLREEPGGAAWSGFRTTASASHIKRVLAGSGEWRLVTGTRLGELLTESFRSALFGGPGQPEECAGGQSGPSRTLGDLGAPDRAVGVIFNTSIVGSWHEGSATAACVEAKSKGLGRFFDWEMRECATVARGGSRLVITNLVGATKDGFGTPRGAGTQPGSGADSSPASGWPLDFEYTIVRDPEVCLAAAASLSANFPPVFSNSAVHFEGDPQERYWVTDGGAVENRGLVSLLLALRAEVRRLLEDPAVAKPAPLAPIKVLVAEASGLSIAYGEDRGVGAALGAASALANKLIAELAVEVNALYGELTGGGSTVEIVYLPMPEALRVSGAFGTNWALPASIEVRDPETRYLKPRSLWRPNGAKVLSLNTNELLGLSDVFFADQNARDDLGLDPDFWKWVEAGGDPRELLMQALGQGD